MTQDIKIIQDESRCEIVKMIYEIRNYMHDNEEAYKNQKILVCADVILGIGLFFMLLTLKFNEGMMSQKSLLFTSILIGLSCVLSRAIIVQISGCTFDAIKYKFGAYGLFLLLAMEDPSVTKIEISRNRKKIKIYRRYRNVTIRNDSFCVEGVGKKVYLINLDTRRIYTTNSKTNSLTY